MTSLFVALMALGLVAAVGYPLWKGVKEDDPLAFAVEAVVQDGVVYTDPDELALDRALGRVGGDAEAEVVTGLDVEDELERRVAALRREKPIASVLAPAAMAQPATSAAGNCPRCGHAYDADDGFCVRCGAALAHTCPGCGRPYGADDLFCSRCGQKL